MRFILGLIFGFVSGIVFVFYAFGNPYAEIPHADDYKDDPNHPTNYVWENLVEVPKERSGADSWFQQEYDALEWSWQKMVRKFDHMQMPDDMAADVITFNYLPWVHELREATERKGGNYIDIKLKILDLRIQSLLALEAYFTDYKEHDYDEYIKYDSAYRELVRDNPEIFD